jgi:PST family polysaccharide transporter
VAQVLVYVQKNCDYWVVSALLGGPALGIYYVAYVLPNILRQRITWVAQVVLIPAFAQIQKAGGDLTTAWRTVWALQAGLGLPALIGVMVLAEPVVLAFFGQQWTDTIPVIRILGISALLNLHMTSVGVVATANRKTLQFVYVAAARTGLTLFAVLVAGTAYHSLVAVAYGVVTASVVAAVIQEYLLAAPLGIGMKSISGLTLRVLLPALLMGATLVAVDNGVSSMLPWLRLLIGVVVGSFTYFGIGLLLFPTTFRSLLSSSRRLLIPR